MDLSAIGRKFRKIGRDTVAEVQKMNDIRQINAKISEQKKQISAIYSQVGQKLYKLYKEAPLEGFDMEFQKIDERFATIEVYNDQIREIKGVRICPNCHTEVSISERYCSACGQKLPEILHIQKDADGNTVIEGTDAEVIDVPESETQKAEEEIPETEEVKAEILEEPESEELKAEVQEEPEMPEPEEPESEEPEEDTPEEKETENSGEGQQP